MCLILIYPLFIYYFYFYNEGPWQLGYFMGIQADGTSSNFYLWQSKYVGDLLHRSKMLGTKNLTLLIVVQVPNSQLILWMLLKSLEFYKIRYFLS